MFYSTSEYQNISKISLYAANFDLLLDCVPIVATVTNIARIVIKAIGLVFQTAMTVMSVTLIPLKLTYIAFSGQTNKKQRMLQAFYRSFKVGEDLGALSYKSFFLSHYTQKTVARSLIDSVPLAGNLAAYFFSKSKLMIDRKKELLTYLESLAQAPANRSRQTYTSYLKNSIVPCEFLQDKDVHLANFKLNPYHVFSMPEQLFVDESFLDQMFSSLTGCHYGLSPYMPADDFIKIGHHIIRLAQKNQCCLEIPMPVYPHTLPEDIDDRLELVKKYPIILWMLPNVEFVQKKQYIAPIMNRYPEVVCLTTEHFLRMNKSVLAKALSLKNELVFIFKDALLAHVLSSKDIFKDDSLLKRLTAMKPSLAKYMNDLNIKKNRTKDIRFL